MELNINDISERLNKKDTLADKKTINDNEKLLKENVEKIIVSVDRDDYNNIFSKYNDALDIIKFYCNKHNIELYNHWLKIKLIDGKKYKFEHSNSDGLGTGYFLKDPKTNLERVFLKEELYLFLTKVINYNNNIKNINVILKGKEYSIPFESAVMGLASGKYKLKDKNNNLKFLEEIPGEIEVTHYPSNRAGSETNSFYKYSSVEYNKGEIKVIYKGELPICVGTRGTYYIEGGISNIKDEKKYGACGFIDIKTIIISNLDRLNEIDNNGHLGTEYPYTG